MRGNESPRTTEEQEAMDGQEAEQDRDLEWPLWMAGFQG